MFAAASVTMLAEAQSTRADDGIRGGNPQECDAGESPNIIVGDIFETARHGRVGDITAYSFGRTACNPGTCWLNWFDTTNQHPVVGYNMHRLKTVNGAARFEQIGMSWLKHEYFALSGALCFTDCQSTNGQHLGIHCSEPSSAGLMGQQSNLGPRSQVNPSTGGFPYPWTAPPPAPTIGRRCQVYDIDLDPALNPAALYFAEIQFIAADDAVTGNGNNNASYRRIVVGAAPNFNISFAGSSPPNNTQRERAAIRAWKEHALGVGIPDPAVEERDVQVPDEGLFILAAKATDLGNGFWRYEYAIQNLNSHRSARSFSVPLPLDAVVQNAGFHDVDYHSGEPFDLTDWTIAIGDDSITWFTQTFDENENANALRWGTLYNFRFDADAAPTTGDVTLGLFRPGSPEEVHADIVAPAPGVPAAMVATAVSRKPNPAGPGGVCDLKLAPPRKSEPHHAGITEVRIGFNVAPGGTDVTLDEATCAAPTFLPYVGASDVTGSVAGNELVLTFIPGLENGRTYRINLGPSVTAIGGQTVEVRGLLGDVNGDGLADAIDRSVVVNVWTGTGFTCETDVDNNGATNATDRSLTVGAWTGLQSCAP